MLVATLALSSSAWSQQCTHLCQQQLTCIPATNTTSISGTVYAPNGIDPLPNVLVYVPNGTVQPFAPGVGCEQSGEPVTGDPLVSTTTATNGTFTLTNMPVGTNIPLVIQAGRWRRQVVIPAVSACLNTPVAVSLTHLPTTQAEGDIPQIAVVTGSADTTECLLRRIGIADSEFTIAAGPGRVHLFEGNGATLPGITTESTLVSSQVILDQYDMVMFGCEGTPNDTSATPVNQQNVIAYANAGGRVVANHYGYAWLDDVAPFSLTANWDTGQAVPPSPLSTFINQSFPKGAQLAAWLHDIGASPTLGEIPVDAGRHDFDGVVSPSEDWLYWQDGSVTVPIQYTFNTPVGASAATQCGRVLYYDYHVESTTGSGTFPSECSTGTMSPQERLAEFGLFDLTVPVSPDVPPTIILGFANTPPTFIQGDSADTIAIDITNTSTTTPTNPSLTATFTVPAGITAEQLVGSNAGTGWICTLGTLTCTRATGLSGTTSDPITLVVSVAANAPTGSGSSVSALIAGGGLAANVSGSDPITIAPPPTYVLTVTAGAGGTLGAGTATNGSYLAGSTQPLVAVPAAGNYFTGWTGAANPGDLANANSPTTTVTMNSTENIVANFAPIPGYVVTTLTDDGNGVSNTPGNAANCPAAPATGSACSLRDALAAAAANNGGAANIIFAPGLNGTYTINGAFLPINGQITIEGPGANIIALSGGGTNQIFNINAGTYTISGLTLENGSTGAGLNGGGIYINPTANVAMTNCVFSNNSAGNQGGAIYNQQGTLTVANCTFFQNTASQGGGGIFSNGGTLTVNYSTFSTNITQNNGGAIFANGPTSSVGNSTFFGNIATGTGGAIFGSSGTTVANSIFSGNSAGSSGGAAILGPITASDNLFFNNLDNGATEDDCNGCTANTSPVSADPNLAPLANYGGPTTTMLPLPSSAAICAASQSLVPVGITTDQRGFPNTITYNSTACYDLGAVQTNYALSFATQPPSSGTVAGTAMSPAPAVIVTESGTTLTTGSISVSATDANSDLTTTPATATTTAGIAPFSSLIFTDATSSDTLTATLALNPTLSLTTPSTSFIVSAITPVINFTPTPGSQTYGTAIGSGPLDATVSVNSVVLPSSAGTISYTTTISSSVTTITSATILPAGTYTITATFTPANSNLYSSVSTPAGYTVNPATLTVTPSPNPATMIYGGTLPALTPAYSGYVNGIVAVPTAPTCTTTGITTTTAVGTYPGSSTCSGGVAPANYAFSYAAGSVTVTPATLTVTPGPNPANMSYGGSLPTLAPSYSGYVNGTVAVPTAPTCITTGITTTTAVGTYPGSSTCSGGAAPANYTFSYATGSVTVNPATLTVTPSPNPATMTYGGTLPTLAPSYSGFVNGTVAVPTAPTCTSTGITATTAAGTYPGSSSCSGGAAPANYTFSYTTGSVTVNKATLIVTPSPNPATMTYGGTFPILTPTYSGYVNGTVAVPTAPTCTTTGITATTAAGTYPGSSGCSGGVAPANYTFGYATGSVTVNKATLTVTPGPNPATMIYGGTLPILTPSYSGYVNGTVAVPTAPTCTTTGITTTTAVGTYPGSGSCSGGVAPANYTFNYATGSVTVSKATLTVNPSPNPATMTYGGALPAITPTYSGYVNGTVAVPTAPICITIGITTTTAVGTYSGSSSCSGGIAPANYTFSYATGSVTVNRASQTITFTLPAGVNYGVAPIALPPTASSGLPITYTVTSGPAAVTGTASAPTLTVTGSGTVKVTASQAGNTNYLAAASVTAMTVVTAVPLASISPATVNLGNIYLGQVVTQTITVTNVGDAAMTINNPLIAILQGGNSSEFSTLDLCPGSLAAGKSCTMTVTFIAGPFFNPQTATLNINTNAAGSPQTVMFTATVIDPVPLFNTLLVNFGTVKTGTSSTAQSVTVTNVGLTTLTVTGVAFAGADPGDFTQTNTCTAALAPKATCKITVVFKPAAKGARSANLVVTDNAQIGTQSILLSGAGN